MIIESPVPGPSRQANETGMKNNGKTVLIIGAAPTDVVDKAVNALAGPHVRLAVVLKEGRSLNAPEEVEILPLRGSVTWRDLYLLRAARRLRPSQVVIVSGHNWFHDNIVNAARFWQLFTSFDIVIAKEGEPGDPIIAENAFPAWVFAALLLAFAALSHLAVRAYSLQALAWIAGAGIGAEALLQAYKRAMSAEARIHDQTSQFTTSKSRNHIAPHPAFGWGNRPGGAGSYHVVMAGAGEFHWSYRHDEDGCRLTGPPSDAPDARPEIFVMGCSGTYGQGVNDEESYPWLLQERFPEYRVRNFAVGAYSLYQMLLRLEHELERTRPAAVVVGAHNLLIGRDVNGFMGRVFFLRSYRSPSCLSRKRKLLRFRPAGYDRLPLSEWILTLRALEYLLNRLRFRGRTGEELEARTARHVLLTLRERCRASDVPFLVTCIDSSEKFYDFLHSKDFAWCVTGVDNLRRLSRGDSSWAMPPFETHPNPSAHSLMAETTAQALEQVLAGRRVRPEPAIVAGHVRSAVKEETCYVYPHF